MNEKMDLELVTRVLQSLGWAVTQDVAGEIQFCRPYADDFYEGGVVDENGHVAFSFYDDWETIDAIRKLLPNNVRVTG